MNIKENDKELVALGNTQTPLALSTSFTGPVHFYDGFNHISGVCLADEDGILLIQHSPDGTNWLGETTTEYTALDYLNFEVQITTPYFRIRFTNGLVGQTSFDLFWYGVRSSIGFF